MDVEYALLLVISQPNIMKSIKSEEFFRLVAVHSGVSDLDLVKRIFYGMVKTISKELVAGKEINLPDWGKFYLKILSPRRSININNGTLINLPATPVVKFTPDYKVKEYFKELGKEDGTMLK